MTDKNNPPKDEKLNDKLSLSENDSDDDEEVRVRSIEKISIVVKSMLSTFPYSVEIGELNTIGELKALLELQYQVTSRTTLIHHNQQLDDSRTVRMSGLKNGSTVFMVPKLRAGPLSQKVNAKAVNRYMETMDEEIKQAIAAVSENSGYPMQEDDTIMMTVDDKGEIRVVRITKDKPEKAKEKADGDEGDEIILETSDESQTQMTRSKVEEMKQKMKRSREGKRKRREEELRKSQQEDFAVKTNSKQASVVSRGGESPTVRIQRQKIKPSYSNVIREIHTQSAMSQDMNNLGVRPVDEKSSARSEDSALSIADLPQRVKGNKKVPFMEEYAYKPDDKNAKKDAVVETKSTEETKSDASKGSLKKVLSPEGSSKSKRRKSKKKRKNDSAKHADEPKRKPDSKKPAEEPKKEKAKPAENVAIRSTVAQTSEDSEEDEETEKIQSVP